uniref:Uncharacterized protein n=1 Tax=viral metagenome TaxID=1070528 RepID=A0A6C0B7A4_9ZZZZ
MNSLPIIEGLTYTTSDVKNLYDHVVSDFNDFFASYQQYIKCNSRECSDNDVKNKLEIANTTLAQFNDAVSQNKNNSNKNTVDLENSVKLLRDKVNEKTKILTDVKHSVNEDYIIKQQSSYYYNMLLSVFSACAIYYIFQRLDNRKL